MDNTLEGAIRSKRRFKRALIIFVAVDLIVTAVGMFYFMYK